eukprot:1152708-Pelagomonas_calceolata.AAC.3
MAGSVWFIEHKAIGNCSALNACVAGGAAEHLLSSARRPCGVAITGGGWAQHCCFFCSIMSNCHTAAISTRRAHGTYCYINSPCGVAGQWQPPQWPAHRPGIEWKSGPACHPPHQAPESS